MSQDFSVHDYLIDLLDERSYDRQSDALKHLCTLGTPADLPRLKSYYEDRMAAGVDQFPANGWARDMAEKALAAMVAIEQRANEER